MAYTIEEVAVLEQTAETNGSISFEQATQLARELCKTPRSVIAKIKQLNLPYTPKEVAPKREKGLTKADLVAEIAKRLGTEAENLAGLTKASAASLGRLVDLT